MLVQNTLLEKPDLAEIIGRLMVDIARGESLVRQRSMMLSIADNRQSLADRRHRLEYASAVVLARLLHLAHDHGLDALAGIHGDDLAILRLAVAPLNREERPVPGGRHPLDTFTDERLVEALYGLAHALRSWEWTAATESCEETSPDEIGGAVFDNLIAATVAAWDHIGQAVTERLAEGLE